LLNLLLNGMEAMAETPAEQRRLKVRTSRNEDGDVEIAVADTGGGIDAADMSRVFDSFFTTKKEGMGLGLALCRSIVETHGGRIWAENNPGGGATFRLVLPVDAEQRDRDLPRRRRGIIGHEWSIADRTHRR
jgi:signal transduction histidine kinase